MDGGFDVENKSFLRQLFLGFFIFLGFKLFSNFYAGLIASAKCFVLHNKYGPNAKQEANAKHDENNDDHLNNRHL